MFQRSGRIPVSVERPKEGACEHESSAVSEREGEREREGDPFPAESKWKEKSTEWRLVSGCRVFCRYSLLSGRAVWRWLPVRKIVARQAERSSPDILPEICLSLAVSWEREASAVRHGKRLWLRPGSTRGVLCWPKESSAQARIEGGQRPSLFSYQQEEIGNFRACGPPQLSWMRSCYERGRRH